MNVLAQIDRSPFPRSTWGVAARGRAAAGWVLMARAEAIWAAGVESWRQASRARATARALASLGPAALRDLGLEQLAEARREALDPWRYRFLHAAY